MRPNLIKNVLASLAISLTTLAAGPAAFAAENTLNIYSARHYPTDDVLYNGFTKATGIQINRVDADDAGILARLRAEVAAARLGLSIIVERTGYGELETTMVQIARGSS